MQLNPVHVLWFCIFLRCGSAEKILPQGVYYISLDPSGNISLYWSVDYNKQYVRFEVHLPLRMWDWFAIGFSDYGEFYPADYCVLWAGWILGSKFEVSFNSIRGNYNILNILEIYENTSGVGNMLVRIKFITKVKTVQQNHSEGICERI